MRILFHTFRNKIHMLFISQVMPIIKYLLNLLQEKII